MFIHLLVYKYNFKNIESIITIQKWKLSRILKNSFDNTFFQALIWFEDYFRIQLKRLSGVNSQQVGSVYYCFTLDHFTCQEGRSCQFPETGMVKLTISLKHTTMVLTA